MRRSLGGDEDQGRQPSCAAAGGQCPPRLGVEGIAATDRSKENIVTVVGEDLGYTVGLEHMTRQVALITSHPVIVAQVVRPASRHRHRDSGGPGPRVRRDRPGPMQRATSASRAPVTTASLFPRRRHRPASGARRGFRPSLAHRVRGSQLAVHTPPAIGPALNGTATDTLMEFGTYSA